MVNHRPFLSDFFFRRGAVCTQAISDRTVIVSGVHGGNLHTTWFCSIKLFPTGTVSQDKNVLVCLGLVSRKQLAGLPLFSSEGWFSRCTQCSRCMRGFDVLRGDGLARSYETCSRFLPFVLRSFLLFPQCRFRHMCTQYDR